MSLTITARIVRVSTWTTTSRPPLQCISLDTQTTSGFPLAISIPADAIGRELPKLGALVSLVIEEPQTMRRA